MKEKRKKNERKDRGKEKKCTEERKKIKKKEK